MIYIKGKGDMYAGTGLYISPLKEWNYNVQIGFMRKTDEKKTLWRFRFNPKLRTVNWNKYEITRDEYEATPPELKIGEVW